MVWHHCTFTDDGFFVPRMYEALSNMANTNDELSVCLILLFTLSMLKEKLKCVLFTKQALLQHQS